VAGAAGPVVAVGLLVAVVAVPPAPEVVATGTSGGAGSGTAEVVRRDLVATRSGTGIVRSADAVVVRAGWAGASEPDPASEAGGTGTDAGAAALDAAPVVATAGEPGTGTGTRSSTEPSAPPTGPTASTTAATDPTASPTDPTASPTDPTASPTDPTGDPTATPTATPTASPTGGAPSAPGGPPAPTSSAGQPPPGGTSGGQVPQGQVPQDQAPQGQAPPDQAPGGSGAGGGTPPGSVPAAGAAQTSPGGVPQDGAAGVATSVVTALAEVGTAVSSGTVLHATDGEPAVAVVSGTPLWRDLDTEADGGADVRALEQALVDAGHGDGVTVDETFTDATADAVERWEEAIGRADPDGRVAVGEVVAVPAGTTVTRRIAALGEEVPAGAELLELAPGSHEITVDVEADDLGPWRVDAEVVVETADGDVPGRVTSVGTAATGGEEDTTATREVVVTPDGSAGLATGSAVTVTVVEDEVADALTVPLGAVVAGPEGEPAVRLRGADGTVTTVGVAYGLVVDGLAEVLSGVDEGDEVVVPS
jgi:hypothetical protein